jgi:hypothetical protein
VRLQHSSANQPEEMFDVKSITAEQSRKLCDYMVLSIVGHRTNSIAAVRRLQNTLGIKMRWISIVLSQHVMHQGSQATYAGLLMWLLVQNF